MDKVDTDTVARAVGLPSKAVSRLLTRLDVKRLSKGRSVPERHDRVYEYPARIHLPDTKRIRQDEARLIVKAIADHRLPRPFPTGLLYRRLGIPANEGTIGTQGHLLKSLYQALLRLGFTSHRPEGFKDKRRWQPATWEPPRDKEGWPRLFQEQRRLRLHRLRERTLNSISAIFSQLPCLGVW